MNSNNKIKIEKKRKGKKQSVFSGARTNKKKLMEVPRGQDKGRQIGM